MLSVMNCERSKGNISAMAKPILSMAKPELNVSRLFRHLAVAMSKTQHLND